MKIIYLLLVIFVILYVTQIFQELKKIKITHDLIDSFNQAFKTKDINKIRRILIPQMPKLKYLNPDYPIDALSYDKSDYEFNEAVKIIYSQLFTIQDYLLFYKWQIINPITPLKDIFLIPSKILSFLGINLNRLFATIVSLLAWIIINYDKLKSVIGALKPIIQKFF
ncbi:hypothetical protein [Streptococcus pyogenes]|uniref:hypothetical protein n=3 Tax=Streptococcus pyogenes TaxID=1314 RepID=UPI0004EF5065|nr:hypothetical protein [Streptococcus pyogenes]HER4763856.1 hypothetical protein [Streptococcus pyogenes NGAS228]AIL11563.1 hypothetical protein DP15_487 [Streptococcus pyogenes]KAB1894638.1 hypothetical protein F8173_02085 [Streptococcus pyogenes]MDA6091786.1 hypothetical protein [Streptococcus pyogenes]MDA6096481.1 hypothetical protein [Streptococcus pyogenes]